MRDLYQITSAIKSVLAAFFGVQSESARKRDFERQSSIPLVAVGCFFVICFVAFIILLAKVAIGVFEVD